MPAKPKPRKPIVVFCELRRPPDEIVNISSQNGAEGVVSRMLPKSHVSHVILNANVSEERFLDMKVSTENKMKKKSMDVHDHFINTFIKRLERKQQRWEREDNYVSKNFQLPSAARRNRMISVDFTIGYPENTPQATPAQSSILYRPAKYPYSSIGTRQRHHAAISSPTKQGEFPPITQTTDGKGQTRLASKMQYEDEKEKQRSMTAFDTHKDVFQRTNVYARTQTKSGRRRRRVAFKEEDKRFEGLMDFLSPLHDKAPKSSLSRLRSVESTISSSLISSNV